MKLLELNPATIKFLTTPDGIRGAVYIGDQSWPGTITFIHRYECAIMLGFNNNKSDEIKEGYAIRWKRLYEKL